jgi:phosphomannomutase
VGHAFFKARMRETGAAFGGEVSGHYYFRDFYCADSGTIPALLILELLSVEGKRMSELLSPLRERYFISGEINSEVEDQDAKMPELAEALQRPALQHGAAAAAEPRIARLRRAHGAEARRGARADPLIGAAHG